MKRRGVLDGYRSPPDNAEQILRLYRLYHAVELWDFFATIGRTNALPSIAKDIRVLSR